MSDIIRDVLIRVGIQKATEAIEPPDIKAAVDRVNEITDAAAKATTDISGSTQAQADHVAKYIETLEQKILATFEKMSQAAMDAMNGTKGQDAEAQKLLDSLEQQAKEIEDLKKVRAELEAQAAAEAKAQRDRDRAQRDAERAEKEALREREQAMREVESLHAQAAKAQNDITDGVLRLARAAALLGASDEEAKKLMQTLADFQMAADIVKGVEKAYAGLNAMMAAASRIKQAEAAASATVVTANAAVAASATAASTAVAGQAAATGAAGGAAVASGGAMAGLAALISPVTIVAGAAAFGIWRLVAAMRELREAQADLQATRMKMFSEEEFNRVLSIGGLSAAQNNLRGDRLRQDNGRDDTVRGMMSQESQDSAIGVDIDKSLAKSKELEAQYQKQFEIVQRIRQADWRMAQAMIGEGIKIDPSQIPMPEVDAQKASLPILEQAREQLERAVSLTKEQYAVKKDILMAQQRELETQRQQLETEKERVDKEKERGEEVARGLGRVGQEDIEKAKVAAAKIAAGQDLTDEDIAAADRLSFGGRSSALEAAAAKRRAASGIDSVRAGLGFESPEDAIRRAEEQQNQINGLLRETNEALNKTREQQVELQTATLEAVKTLSTELARMQGIINDLKDNIQANGG